ncbi:helix-turn-helix transcriptional regulator [Frondihabitans australicus]|uniref:helix-turn-helix transcriptional regulator n=1 Tax=Frondihabitans australicus TaxID=386892 RepID=UPI0014757840|nr:LuxR C-terminal-related transcriptional regulator [Frondihabitans australicus]
MREFGTPRQTTSSSAVQGLSNSDGFPTRGRAAETARITATIDALYSGTSQTLIIRGIPGVGKTRALQDAAHTARERGLNIIFCRPDPESFLMPLAPLLDAINEASRSGTRLALDPHTTDPASRYWIAQQVQETVEQLALDSGVAFIVDDLQWCDPGSLNILRTLSNRLSDMPILWLLAVRADQQSADVEATVDAHRASGDVLNLEPLDTRAVEAMVSDLLHATPDAAVLEAVERTGNVPLLVKEFVQGLEDEHLVTTQDGVATMETGAIPQSFGISTMSRLRRLPAATQNVIQAASVLGRRFTLSSLGQLTQMPQNELLAAAKDATDAGVFIDDGHHRAAFRHDIVRETVEQSIPPSLRDLLIREAASILLKEGDPLLSIATRVAASAKRGDRIASNILSDAADALTTADASQAAQFALRAIQLVDALPCHAALTARFLPLLWSGGLHSEARELLARLEGRLTPEQEGEFRLAVSRIQAETTIQEAMDAANAGLALPGIPSTLRARLLASKAMSLANQGLHDDMRATLRAARTEADVAGDAMTLAFIETGDSMAAFNENAFDDALTLITSAMKRVSNAGSLPPSRMLPEGLWPACLANSTGDTARADRITQDGIAETEALHDIVATSFWTMFRSRVLLDQGRLDEAKTLAEAALELADDLENGFISQSTIGLVLFRVALLQADRPALDRYRRFAVSMAASQPLRRIGKWLLALEAEQDGDWAAATALTQEAYDTLEQPVPSMTSPADFFDDVTFARMMLAAGRPDRLARIISEADRRAELNPTNDLCRGIVLHLHGLREDDAEAVAAAAEYYRRIARPLILASALEDIGILRAGDDASNAESAWQEALALFESSGASRESNRVKMRLRSIGVFPRDAAAPPSTDLTNRELEVLARVAAGLTTQQIAADLFISPHTVTSHVRHMYAKWGVNSRRALRSLFDGQAS